MCVCVCLSVCLCNRAQQAAEDQQAGAHPVFHEVCVRVCVCVCGVRPSVSVTAPNKLLRINKQGRILYSMRSV